MTRHVDLDHVALASHDVKPILDTLVGELGGRVLFGGLNFGFRAMQIDCGGSRVELLEPWNVERSDFLARFLDTNGEGPHHLTFKTDDIRRDLEFVREAGYHPVGINIDNPFWQEAFLHPKEAGGTVVQLAQSDMDPLQMAGLDPALMPAELGDRGPARWWGEPPPTAADPARLVRVVVTTEEMMRSLELYEKLLCGETSAHGEGWVELSWPSGGCIRLEMAAGRPPGIDRLEWTWRAEPRTRTVGGTRFAIYSG